MTAQTGQLELGQTFHECERPFSDLGVERCEHETVRGNRCTQIGEYDGLHGLVLCDQHANDVDA